MYIHAKYSRSPFQISIQQIHKPSVSLVMSISELQYESDVRSNVIGLRRILRSYWILLMTTSPLVSLAFLVGEPKFQHVFTQDNLAAGVTNILLQCRLYVVQCPGGGVLSM